MLHCTCAAPTQDGEGGGAHCTWSPHIIHHHKEEGRNINMERRVGVQGLVLLLAVFVGSRGSQKESGQQGIVAFTERELQNSQWWQEQLLHLFIVQQSKSSV